MYAAIPLDDLKEMAVVAERRPPEMFTMAAIGDWECGTAGCLLGCYQNHIGRWWHGCRDIPGKVSYFLFFHHRIFLHDPLCRDAIFLTQEEAIARLRKYIRYVERKRALWADHDWLMGLSRRHRHEELGKRWLEEATI